MKKITALLMAVIIIFFAVSSYSYMAQNKNAVSYRWGSSGPIVVEIQRRLKAWGYYTGGLDGTYGYLTYTAVRRFQAANGLSVDGIAGSSTLTALGINAGQYSNGGYSSNTDATILARAIYAEARGESFTGMVAVGAVIINRTRDPRFPRTIAGVIYQPGAFTAVADGQINLSPDYTSMRAARDALNGWDPSGGALYYYNPAKTTSSWIWSRPIIKVIGRHYFCR